MTTYEEWRVTGEPGYGFPSYEFVWSDGRNSHLGDPEQAARQFVALIQQPDHTKWDEGPYLSRRTVTVSDWEDAEW